MQDVWTGSGALSYELTGLTAGTQYDVQARAVNATGDGPWSTTATGIPTIAPTPCSTGGAVPNPHDNLDLVSDCDILLAVRDTLAGSGTLNWATSTPITDWDGITVGGTPQRVTALYLGHMGLTGTIPTELGSLTGLTQLSIFDTQVTGPIPAELGSLTNLRWLTLHNNQLSGDIPVELTNLSSLEQLYLSGNGFTGCVPAELRNIRETDRSHQRKEIGVPYCDVLLSGLSISAADLRPGFDPYVTRYTAAATASSITVSPASQHNATFQYLDQNDGVLADADGTQAGHQVDVPVGVVTTIQIRVNTSDGLDSRTYTIEVTGLGGLSAPSIRQITSGVSSLTVSWREPSQTGGSAVTAYDLRHIRSDALSKADSIWTVVQDVWTGSGALNYDLTGLQGAVQYDIQVRAVNATGDGPWSATVSQTARGTVPGAPTGLAATATGQTQIDLSWSSPQNTGTGNITGYRIEVSPDDSSWSDLVADSRSTTTSYSHTGLTASSTRHYRVSAINSEGAGPASNVANATTGAALAPDLVVDTPTVSDNVPTVGARITVNATVRNQGNGHSDSTTLRYYQSTDSNITTSDTEVGTDSVFRLNASRSGNEFISLTSPSTPGTYYYGACVDAVTGESDTTNNCSSGIQVTVGAAPAPDLVVDTPTVSDSAPTAGARITLNATVRNQGNGRSDSTTLRYYESTDSTITTSDMELETDYVPRLDPSDSSDESTNLIALSNPGITYLGVCVDTVTGESDTTNNCSAAVAVTVGAAPTPDLVVDAPKVSDSNPSVGARYTLNARVRNQGNGRSDSTTLRYYESADSTITTGDRELDTDYVSRLDPSESGDESVRLTAISPGTYYLGACVDAVTSESDTTNNCSVAVAVTIGAAPTPANTPGAPSGLTATASGQNRIDLSWTAPSNDGGAVITGYRIQVSTDGSSWSDLVADTGSTATSHSDTGLTAGDTRYYQVSAINSAGTGRPSNTVNATTAAARRVTGAPDLVVENTNLRANLTPGYHWSPNATVRNQGNGASVSTTLRYYRSDDATITTGDTEVDTDPVEGLEPSASSREATGLKVPTTPGIYYYGACVDAVPGETDTTNNCSTATEVTVRIVNSPPQVVGNVDDLTVKLGEGFRVDISGVFRDPDGENVTNYGFSLRTSGILSGAVHTTTGILNLRAIGVGTTIVAVDAADIHGNGSGSHDLFRVTVVPADTTATVTPTTPTPTSTPVQTTPTPTPAPTTPTPTPTATPVPTTSTPTATPTPTPTSAPTTPTPTPTPTPNTPTPTPTPAPTTPTPTPTAVPDTKTVTGSISECSGELRSSFSEIYDVTITGTLTANRAVRHVRVEGYVDGSILGFESIGDMAAGESVMFAVTGIVSSTPTSCEIKYTWLE